MAEESRSSSGEPSGILKRRFSQDLSSRTSANVDMLKGKSGITVDIDRLSRLDQSLSTSVRKYERIKQAFLLVLYSSLLIDFMLYSVIVAIIPLFLTEENNGNAQQEGNISYKGNHSSNVEKFNFAEMITLLNATPSVQLQQHASTGILFASNALVQLVMNPIAGLINDRFNSTVVPMFVGLAIGLTATVIYGFGTTYWVLLSARSIQGVGSALIMNSVMTVLVKFWTDQVDRQRVVGLAVLMISEGCLLGPPFGAFLDEFAGKPAPFLTLAAAILLVMIALVFITVVALKKAVIVEDSWLQAATFEPQSPPETKTNFDDRDVFAVNDVGLTAGCQQTHCINADSQQVPPSDGGYCLLTDPYIIVTAGSLFTITLPVGCIEPTIMVWVHQKMSASKWQFGVTWMPSIPAYVVGVWLADAVQRRRPGCQWWLSIVGHFVAGSGCLSLLLCNDVEDVVIPILTIAFGRAVTEATVMPLFGRIVDLRGSNAYGGASAAAETSYQVSLAIGPIVAGYLAQFYGFEVIALTVGLFIYIYMPFLLIIRKINRCYEPLITRGLDAD